MSDKCYFCPETERLETHHIVPRRHNGSDKKENLVKVCPTCHSKLESIYDSRFYSKMQVRRKETTQDDIAKMVRRKVYGGIDANVFVDPRAGLMSPRKKLLDSIVEELNTIYQVCVGCEKLTPKGQEFCQYCGTKND